MTFNFPAVYAVSEKHESGNKIYQMTVPGYSERVIKVTKYTKDEINGTLLKMKGGEEILLVTDKIKSNPFQKIIRVTASENLTLDKIASLREGKIKQWSAHPSLKAPSKNLNYLKKQGETLSSWDNAFQFRTEKKDAEGEVISLGLRSPQMGALHAIQAHWAISMKPATVVLPTGVGKTETMLATLVVNQLKKVLVVVPTDALREQISDKFISLGLLKELGLLDRKASYPIVGILKRKFKTAAEADDYFKKCHVIVSTINIVGQSPDDIQQMIVGNCTHLFIDEAHHTEASTWKSFKIKFKEKIIVQFTATPFRNDGKEIDGKVIFEYSLSQAQHDGYYKTIKFEEVMEWIPAKWDAAISKKAIEVLKTDISNGFDHILMARVLTIERAREVFDYYKPYLEFNPVQIHTGLTHAERKKIKEVILNKQSRIIVCVDMLGEGFDLPELKIAAFHDIRQSLPITIQIVGRFTRAQAKLGNPTIIANVADPNVNDELIELYSYGADWNLILSEINFRKSREREQLWDFFKGFEDIDGGVSLQSLVPALSTVIYKTNQSKWYPEKFEEGINNFKSFDKVYSNINRKENILVIILGKREQLIWARLKEIYEWHWEMIILYWNSSAKLLFVNTTSNSSYYQKLAESILGKVELIRGPNIFRCFDGINRMKLKNVGLREQFGKLISFIMRFGSDVESGLSEAQKRTMTKVVIMGTGYEFGEKVSAGCSLKGRIWYQRRNYINTLVKWCDLIGSKVVNDKLDPDQILKGTLKTEIRDSRPPLMPICIDWPDEFYREVETSFKFNVDGTSFYLFECSLELISPDETSDIVFALVHESNKFQFKLTVFSSGPGSSDFRVKNLSGKKIEFAIGPKRLLLEEFFGENPPTIWFVDGSSLMGNIFAKLPSQPNPYPKEKIIEWNWVGTNIKKESQGLKKEKDSIQKKVIDYVKTQDNDLVFDDDDCGEVADVVTVSYRKEHIILEFYHCKFSSEIFAGARIKDMYEVCGQAQKCIQWMENPKEVIKHLLRRENKRKQDGKVTRIEKGSESELINFQKLSRNTPIKLKAVFIVQPGLSKSKVSTQQLELLAVTENYLMETRMVPFVAIASK